MARTKQQQRQQRQKAAAPSPTVGPATRELCNRRELETTLKSAVVTQLLDLEVPEASELTAKFAATSKYHSLLYPGSCGHLGDTPSRPPLRSDIYARYPELQGKKYATSVRDIEMAHPGITRRWNKVCSLGRQV